MSTHEHIKGFVLIFLIEFFYILNRFSVFLRVVKKKKGSVRNLFGDVLMANRTEIQDIRLL